MMSTVVCPTCQHKQLLPEGEMGKLQNCPSCRSSFVAGKSTAESRRSPFPAPSTAPPPGFNKTMLADAGAAPPPIKYNCPRCNAALEAPASQGGTKINCPHCSQRLQVPAAPKAAAPPPGLNRTMLASDGSAAPPPPLMPPIKFNCPNCRKPLEAPGSEAGTKKNCQYCSQRYQVPAAAASSLNKTKLASSDEGGTWHPSGAPSSAPATAGKELPDGKGAAAQITPLHVALGVIALLLLILVVPAVINGGKRADAEASAKHQLELEKLKAEIEQKKTEMDRQKSAESETRKQLEMMMERMRQQDEKMRNDHLALIKSIADAKQKSDLEEKFNAAQRKLDEEKREMERKQQQVLEETKRQLAESKRAMEAAQQKQQTIIHQPPPVMYYPPYHPRYYWPW